MLTLYLIFSFIVIIFFIVQYPIFSYTYLFLAVLFAASLATLSFYHVVNVSLLALCLLLPLCRLIYLVFFEIRYILGVMTRRRSIFAISKTCLLWLPFPLFAIAGYYMLEIRDERVYDSIEHFVYQEIASPKEYACGKEKLVCRCEGSSLSILHCPLVDADFYSIKKHAGEMERNFHIAIQRLKSAFKQDVLSQIQRNRQDIIKEINTNGGDIEKVLFDGELSQQKLLDEINNMAAIISRGNTVGLKKIKDTKRPVFKYFLAQYHPSLLPPPCNGVVDQLFKLRDCIKNIALEPLSNTYIDVRHELRQYVVQTIAQGKGSVEEKLTVVEKVVERMLDQQLNDYSRLAHQGVDNNFAILRTIDQVSFLIWLIMVAYALLIGFLYLFVRYVYNQKHGGVPFFVDASRNGCENENDDKLKKTIIIEDITLDDTMNSFSQSVDRETWYASIDSALRYEVDGIICLPRPFTLLLKRLPGRYLLFRYRRQEGKKMISAHADDLTRFIKITLHKGQSVCFNLSNLVAFSDSLQMKSTLSVQLAAFFQSQLFFSTAIGPGEFIIRTKSGKPEIMPDSGVKPSDPRDVVVFDLYGQYSLLADVNLLSAYFLGHRIIPCGNTVLIRQSPNANGSFSSQASAIRRTLYLLLPLTFVTIVLPWLLP